jgi:hypothetical protein
LLDYIRSERGSGSRAALVFARFAIASYSRSSAAKSSIRFFQTPLQTNICFKFFSSMLSEGRHSGKPTDLISYLILISLLFALGNSKHLNKR